ncbi:MAG TPA: carbon-nitrogen hydrolase family protein [bacterium]|nr:carbon-nitrogen hydrolase family protein [bacterium]
MRIALCQLVSSPHKTENLEAARLAIREAKRKGADVALLPEVFMAFLAPESPVTTAEVAEPADGPFVSALAAEARAQRLYVGCGIYETAPGERTRAHNTTVLLGPDGDLLLRYRKTHLYDAFGFRESDRIVPGAEPPGVVRTPLGTFGLLVCYELRFPELTRMVALAGADVLLLPAAWVAGALKEYHWVTLLAARAIENTIFVAAADQVGTICAGRSRLVDPMGVTLVDAGEEAGVVVGEVDLERIARVREKLPALQHRREALYAPREVSARR